MSVALCVSDRPKRTSPLTCAPGLFGLHRKLEIDFSDGLYPTSWPDALSLVSTSVTHLRNLVSFSLESADPDSAYLTYGLQLALLTHPTLREIAYDKFWHQMTYLRPSFERTRPHPLMIHAISFPQPSYQHTHQSLTLDGLINRLGPYLEHFSIHVRTFHLRVGEHEGPVDSHPLSKLLSATLPALEELHLSFEHEESFPDLLGKGDFLSLFLAVNSSVSRINLASDDDADTPAHLYLPLEGLTRIRGLDGVAPPDLRDWTQQTPLKEVDLRFRRGVDMPGSWDLVGLEVSQTECDWGHDCDVPPDFVGALASKFPELETLRFKDFFDMDCAVRSRNMHLFQILPDPSLVCLLSIPPAIRVHRSPRVLSLTQIRLVPVQLPPSGARFLLSRRSRT